MTSDTRWAGRHRIAGQPQGRNLGRVLAVPFPGEALESFVNRGFRKVVRVVAHDLLGEAEDHVEDVRLVKPASRNAWTAASPTKPRSRTTRRVNVRSASSRGIRKQRLVAESVGDRVVDLHRLRDAV